MCFAVSVLLVRRRRPRLGGCNLAFVQPLPAGPPGGGAALDQVGRGCKTRRGKESLSRADARLFGSRVTQTNAAGGRDKR